MLLLNLGTSSIKDGTTMAFAVLDGVLWINHFADDTQALRQCSELLAHHLRLQ